MPDYDEVRTELVKLINNQVVNLACFTGRVLDVDSKNKTCTVAPSNGDPEYHDVRLTPAINEETKGIIPIPKKGSHVVCGKLTRNVAFVINCSEVDKYIFRNMEMELNGDGLGGLVILKELKDNLGKLKDYDSALKGATATALIAIDTALTALLPLVGSAWVPQAPIFDGTMATQVVTFGDMENKKVKHGN